MPSVQQVWVPERGWVAVDEATATDLRANHDFAWLLAGTPGGKLESAAKRPAVARGIDLREVEQMILSDEWIGTNQRAAMLRELRALATYYGSRKEMDDA